MNVRKEREKPDELIKTFANRKTQKIDHERKIYISNCMGEKLQTNFMRKGNFEPSIH
jgi:hypothetical protein